jgi:aminoglycoside phosphotransferase family enzyme/predicted kinase
MELVRLIAELSQPSAYPVPVADVEVRQTHASVVFLAGPFAYKVKKPVNLGFLDFSTLPQRRHFCEEEVRLNRRLAASVYLGVVPVGLQDDRLRLEGGGEVVEWAVKMRRLPDDATFQRRLLRGELGESEVRLLACRLAEFHAQADRGPGISVYGRFSVVAGNARENFTQARAQIGRTLTAAVFERLLALTEQALGQLQPLIEERAQRGVPRDTHGDVHLDHVYFFPGQPPPHDLVIVDCIEFNERFRYADPICDLAFAYMDLLAHRRPDLAQVLAESYFEASGDEQGRRLLPFYAAYRAAVRGKVEGMKASEPEVPQTERDTARLRSRKHWLLALGLLEVPEQRPGLVLVAGLPGTGKSTLARNLAARAGLQVIRSDLVRKELAGIPGGQSAAAEFGQGLYTPAWTERTYAECLRRAEAALEQGQRVIVDASFHEERQRLPFVKLAASLAVPVAVLECRASPEAVRSRIERRQGDASDATWTIYQELAQRWQPPGPVTQAAWHSVWTEGPPEGSVLQALAVLRTMGMLGPERTPP